MTHDVDEAVLLGDRIVVMAPRPGRIARIVTVSAARPRDRRDPALAALRTTVLDTLEAAQSAATPAPVPLGVPHAAPRPGLSSTLAAGSA